MIEWSPYVLRFKSLFGSLTTRDPWYLTQNAQKILVEKINSLGPGYKVFNNVAIHETVSIDSHAILKGPAIISPHCFIGAHSYLRGGVFLDEKVSLGPGCEVKASYVFSHSALAHFNFVGDSILGSHVNMEAGAVIANHYNERKDKKIMIRVDGESHTIDSEKFGALVGDNTKIGANAVLSPGTILRPDTIVKRLQLIDQAVDS